MPTYEYHCQDCDHDFEAFQSMSEAPLKTCPACGGHHVKRLISAGVGFIFKGSGFYITDYKKKPAETAEKPEGKKPETADKKITDKKTPDKETPDKKTKEKSD
jgi:putative FmdB family regulatory protein